MSELQKITRAKNYMDQLSRGINPITNQSVSNELRNERLMKCFSYISALLDTIIQSGGDIEKIFYKPVSQNFSQINTALSQEPVAVKAFAKKIEEGGGLPISPVKITSWLVSGGYLKDIIDENGKKSREVTDKGIELGITTQAKTHFNGESYQMNFYDKQAQQFILSHLNEIIFFKSVNRANNFSAYQKKGKY